MNRSELIAAMAEKTNSTKVDADKTISAVIDIITSTLKREKTLRSWVSVHSKLENVPPEQVAIPRPAQN